MPLESRQLAADLDAPLLFDLSSIDTERRELFEQLKIMIYYSARHPDAERFSVALSQLGQQLWAHFESEEKLFKHLDTPVEVISSHVQANTEILEQYALLNIDLMQGKIFSRTKVTLMIKHWIVDHFLRHDLTIKRYESDRP